MIQKLKREWKTFAWGILGITLSTWEFVATSYLDWGALIPEGYRPAAMLVIPIGFFLLRQWKDAEDA